MNRRFLSGLANASRRSPRARLTLGAAGLLAIGVALGSCDKGPGGEGAADAAPSATASTTPLPPSIPAPPPEPVATASPAPTAAAEPAPAKDVTLPVRDPAADSQKTVKAIPGGSVTLYLPDYPGTTWVVEGHDKGLGKPKEQTIPGFAGPSTPGHEFKWATTSPSLKVGQSHKVKLINKKGAKATGTTFTLGIDFVGG